MPSPIGHALAGIIAGTLASAVARIRPQAAITPGVIVRAGNDTPGANVGGGSWRDALLGPWRRLPADVRLFAWLGMAADLDFLIGRHSYETHSIGAAVLVLAAIAAWSRTPRLAVAGALAYASHILLDWLGSDTVPPIGIMALFPFTTDFYQSDLFVFDAISRRIWTWSTWVHNGGAVARELAILGPLVVLSLAVYPGWRYLRARWRA